MADRLSSPSWNWIWFISFGCLILLWAPPLLGNDCYSRDYANFHPLLHTHRETVCAWVCVEKKLTWIHIYITFTFTFSRTLRKLGVIPLKILAAVVLNIIPIYSYVLFYCIFSYYCPPSNYIPLSLLLPTSVTIKNMQSKICIICIWYLSHAHRFFFLAIKWKKLSVLQIETNNGIKS